MAISCLVFDCDGVLLDSVPVKSTAFARLAEPYGEEARDRLLLFHALHGGVSRYEKFAWFFRNVLKREISPEESAEWGRKFAEYSLDEVRKCPLVPGALEVLEKWRGVLPLYVCSGAPQEELRMVLGERGIASFFTGIYGSPPGKTELLARIIRLAGVAASETLMIGDAITDRNAAEATDAQFYGIGEDLRGGPYPWAENLTSLNEWVSAHVA